MTIKPIKWTVESHGHASFVTAAEDRFLVDGEFDGYEDGDFDSLAAAEVYANDLNQRKAQVADLLSRVNDLRPNAARARLRSTITNVLNAAQP